MTTIGLSSLAFTMLPFWTSRLPVRPSMGARMVVYATCSLALSTLACAARVAAFAFSTAARSACTVASSAAQFVRS